MTADDRDITPSILLEHLQAMEGRLTERVAGVQNDVRELQTKMHRMEVNLTAQIEAIDERLDAIEIEQLPKRVAALEGARR